ncbi:hypothetical protein Ancab_015866 [Ancistrocladus abbreviatus]
MGSGSSKSRRIGGRDGGCGLGSSSSLSPSLSLTAGSSRRVSRGRSVLRSSCLGLSARTCDSDDDDQVFHHHDEETGSVGYGPRIHHAELESDEAKVDDYQKLKLEQPDDVPCLSSNIGPRECGQTSSVETIRGPRGRIPTASSARSSNCSGRFLSRFSFLSGSVSFRLSRATSLDSEQAYPLSTMSFTVSNDVEDSHLSTDHPRALVNRNENQQCDSLQSAYFSSTSPRPSYDDGFGNSRLNCPSSSLHYMAQDCQILSDQDLVRDYDSDRTRSAIFVRSLRSQGEMDELNSRNVTHCNGTQAQPGDRNVQFSRTLSVGRLRDRVLRRSSFSDTTFSPSQQERELGNSDQGGRRQVCVSQTRTMVSEENAMTSLSPSTYSLSDMSGPFNISQNHDAGTLQTMEARYNDLLEQRSNFLERRRRISSQVRALERLGSRFENLSGHERSCILSGQHQSGRCTCPLNTQDFSSNDDHGGRASISRIVMLAEALFEVLDEIHQQSVVLSSQPSISSIGSVPAPNEVVESLPIKMYSKFTNPHNEEVPQCYICLVEYEEGDKLRILPCHHEFHRTCIDKWLKEIHRVCPLCRRDVCRSNSSCVES